MGRRQKTPQKLAIHEGRQGVRKEIQEILERDFFDSPFWGLKDPRMCRLIPLWLHILKDFGCEPHFVHVPRNPFEVSGSLAGRNSFPAAKSQLSWLCYLQEAERMTDMCPG